MGGSYGASGMGVPDGASKSLSREQGSALE